MHYADTTNGAPGVARQAPGRRYGPNGPIQALVHLVVLTAVAGLRAATGAFATFAQFVGVLAVAWHAWRRRAGRDLDRDDVSGPVRLGECLAPSTGGRS